MTAVALQVNPMRYNGIYIFASRQVFFDTYVLHWVEQFIYKYIFCK